MLFWVKPKSEKLFVSFFHFKFSAFVILLKYKNIQANCILTLSYFNYVQMVHKFVFLYTQI